MPDPLTWPGSPLGAPGETKFSFTRGDPRFETTMAYAHLDRLIAPTIFSVRTNRRLFRGMVRLTETTSWQRASQVAREYSRWALADPDVGKDPERLRSLGREHTRLAPVVRLADRLVRLQDELEQARALAEEPDPELVALVKDDLARLPGEIASVSAELHELLLQDRAQQAATVDQVESSTASVTREIVSRPISVPLEAGQMGGDVRTDMPPA